MAFRRWFSFFFPSRPSKGPSYETLHEDDHPNCSFVAQTFYLNNLASDEGSAPLPIRRPFIGSSVTLKGLVQVTISRKYLFIELLDYKPNQVRNYFIVQADELKSIKRKRSGRLQFKWTNVATLSSHLAKLDLMPENSSKLRVTFKERSLFTEKLLRSHFAEVKYYGLFDWKMKFVPVKQ